MILIGAGFAVQRGEFLLEQVPEPPPSTVELFAKTLKTAVRAAGRAGVGLCREARRDMSAESSGIYFAALSPAPTMLSSSRLILCQCCLPR